MIFSKQKAESLTAEEVRDQFPDLFTSIADMANSEYAAQASESLELVQKENDELKAKLQQVEKAQQISTYAAKLGVDPKDYVDSDKSFAEVLQLMVNASVEEKEDFEESFDQTASSFAGSSDNSEDQDSEVPDTLAEAATFVMQRDNCSRKDAVIKLKIEKPTLFSN